MTNPDVERLRERMDGDYEAPILAEPAEERPVPQWSGDDEPD